MQKTFSRNLAVACVLSLGSSACIFAPAFAQSTTQGGIAGTVFDSTNAAVANASVVIHNDGTNAEVKLTAGGSGEYKAPQLDPGTYTVTVSAPGFQEIKTSNIVVQVQQVTELNPHLSSGSESQVVEVVADIPAINFESPEFGGHLNNREIESIPINNRRWSSLALTTPGVTNDASGFGLLSFRAISAVLNNVQIDGADDNQAFFSEERGRTRAGYSTSQAMVREFQVNTGVYSAEFGRAVGGVINSVTKTGTNSLHGEAYFYRRDDQFSAFNPYTSLGTFNSSGTFSQRPFRPKDKRNQYGFEVGGPIVKDKVFFVYAFDVFDRQFPGIARPNSAGTFFTSPLAAVPAGDTCNTTTGVYTNGTPAGSTSRNPAPSPATSGACLLGARLRTTYANGVASYNTQLQALSTDLGQVPRYGHQDINTPKISWQVTPKHNVSFLYHRLRWDSPGGVQTQASVGDAVDSFGTDFVKLDYGLAKLDSIFGNSIANELRYQYGRELNDEGQQPYSTYTKNNLQNPTTGNVAAYSIFTSAGFAAGQQTYSNRVAYPDERKWQIGDTASLTHGKHNIRIGEDIVHNHDLQNQLFNAGGTFTYGTSITNYFSDLLIPKGSCNTALTGVGTLPCYNTYSQGFGPAVFQLDTTDLGFFVQDDWKLTPRLTLNLGARYDYEMLPSPYQNLATIPQTLNAPSDKNNIAPRIGFAYDPFGLGKTVVRGGFGMYYGRIPNAVLLNGFQATGSAASQTNYTFTNSSANAPLFRNQVASAPTSSGAGNISYFAKNFQNPGTYQMDFAVQQDLGRNNVLSAQYLGALGRELPNYININLDPTRTYQVTYNVVPNSAGNCGPLNCGQISSRVYAGRVQTTAGGTLSGTGVLPNPSYGSITQLISNINSSYNAFSVDVTNRTLKWATFDANYTWAHALDFSQNQFTGGGTNNWLDPFGNQRLNYGNSSLDVRHRAVGWAILNLPGRSNDHDALSYLTNGWSVKPLIQVQTGLPYSATVSGSTPQQCFAVGCLAASSATNTGLLGTGVTYLPQVGRNTFKYPRSILVDTRLQKNFKLHDNYSLELFAEAFNLANHQNVTAINSGAYTLTSAAVQGNPAAAPVSNLTLLTSFATPSATNGNYAYSPRQFQFAARLVF